MMTTKYLDRLEQIANAIGDDAASENEREGILEQFADADTAHAALVDAVLVKFPSASWSSILRADASESAELRNVLGRWLASKDICWPGAQIMKAARIPRVFDSCLAAGAKGIIQIFACTQTQTADRKFDSAGAYGR